MGTLRDIESSPTCEWKGYKLEAEQIGLKLWSKPSEILDDIEAGHNQILIRSCNGAGKTTLLAAIIALEMKRHKDVQVICTGATYDQVKNTLWRSVKRFARATSLDVSNFVGFEWHLSPSQNCIALSPKKVESAQGFHAERVVVIIDEATGMDRDKITALLSNATGQNSLIIFTYNPINPDCAVYDLESQDGWRSYSISAFDHPNVIEGVEVIRGAVTREFVERALAMDSEKCDWYYPDAIQLEWNHTAYIATPEALARVKGEWSESITYGFISGSVVVDSWKVESRVGLRCAGADIGGGGDDPSMWTAFFGNQQIAFESINTAELGVVAAKLDKFCIDNSIDILGIDDTGVGHGVTDRLQEIKPKYKIVPIHFGKSPFNFPEVKLRRPSNARCEMYLLLEKEMRSGSLRILYDKELQKELCSQKIVEHRQSDTMRLEDKSLIKKRIGRSPNKADATAIARYAMRIHTYQTRPIAI